MQESSVGIRVSSKVFVQDTPFVVRLSLFMIPHLFRVSAFFRGWKSERSSTERLFDISEHFHPQLEYFDSWSCNYKHFVSAKQAVSHKEHLHISEEGFTKSI